MNHNQDTKRTRKAREYVVGTPPPTCETHEKPSSFGDESNPGDSFNVDLSFGDLTSSSPMDDSPGTPVGRPCTPLETEAMRRLDESRLLLPYLYVLWHAYVEISVLVVGQYL